MCCCLCTTRAATCTALAFVVRRSTKHKAQRGWVCGSDAQRVRVQKALTRSRKGATGQRARDALSGWRVAPKVVQCLQRDIGIELKPRVLALVCARCLARPGRVRVRVQAHARALVVLRAHVQDVVDGTKGVLCDGLLGVVVPHSVNDEFVPARTVQFGADGGQGFRSLRHNCTPCGVPSECGEANKSS